MEVGRRAAGRWMLLTSREDSMKKKNNMLADGRLWDEKDLDQIAGGMQT